MELVRYEDPVSVAAATALSMAETIDAITHGSKEEETEIMLPFLVKIIMVIRLNFRKYFGLNKFDRYGHFIDHHWCPIIRDYGYWVDYPKGNFKLSKHTRWVWAAAITKNGRHLYTTSRDRRIIHWDLQTHRIRSEWQAHSRAVYCLALGRRSLLVSGSENNEIRLWSRKTHQLIDTLEGHKEAVMSVALSNDEQTLCSGSTDNTICLWSKETGNDQFEKIRVLTGHTDTVSSLMILMVDTRMKKNDRIIVSASEDGSIRKWNPDTGKCYETVTEKISMLAGKLSLNCDQSRLACVSVEKILIFRWSDDSSMSIEREIWRDAYSVRFHPYIPHILAIGCWNGTVQMVDVRGDSDSILRIVKHFELGHDQVVRDLCFTPDAHRLVSVSDDQSVKVWDISDTATETAV